MKKKELREQMRTLKRAHSVEERNLQSNHILQQLEQTTDFQQANTIMLYYALADEVQTDFFIERWRLKKRLILPTVVSGDIVPVELKAETLFSEGSYHILEPQNEPYSGPIDLIIVPGVAFDLQGHRLGRGGGYYDRFLSNYQEVKKIGICFDFQVLPQIPTDSHDIAMDEVLFFRP